MEDIYEHLGDCYEHIVPGNQAKIKHISVVLPTA